MSNRRPAIARVVLLAGMLAGACASTPLTEIGESWYVDQGPTGKPAAHLYHVLDGTRVIVDRQIEAYRLYFNMCLVYQVSRPEGRVFFGVGGSLTPVAIVASDAFQSWRLDTDGLRQFDTAEDPDGRKLLKVAWIKAGDVCTAIQMQPAFTADWAAAAHVKPGRFTIEESVLDVNASDNLGNSTLGEAVREGRVVVVDELLRAGADANSANKFGIAVLTEAVVHRHLDVVRRLLKAGARVNAQDNRGETALMWAARYGKPDMAEILLGEGADVNIRDDSGQTAVGWVRDGGTADVKTLRDRLERAAAGRK